MLKASQRLAALKASLVEDNTSRLDEALSKSARPSDAIDRGVEDWWNITVPALNKEYSTKFKATGTSLDADFDYVDTAAGKFKVRFRGVYRYTPKMFMYLRADVVGEGRSGSYEQYWDGNFPASNVGSYVRRVIDYAIADSK